MKTLTGGFVARSKSIVSFLALDTDLYIFIPYLYKIEDTVLLKLDKQTFTLRKDSTIALSDASPAPLPDMQSITFYKSDDHTFIYIPDIYHVGIGVPQYLIEPYKGKGVPVQVNEQLGNFAVPLHVPVPVPTSMPEGETFFLSVKSQSRLYPLILAVCGNRSLQERVKTGKLKEAINSLCPVEWIGWGDPEMWASSLNGYVSSKRLSS